VKRLGLAWSWETESPSDARIESTRLFSNGVLYATLGWNVMVALDARTGRQKWRWDPEIPRKQLPDVAARHARLGSTPTPVLFDAEFNGNAFGCR
jgi:glucose dehydrogenase